MPGGCLWQRSGYSRTRQYPHPPPDDRRHLRHLSGTVTTIIPKAARASRARAADGHPAHCPPPTTPDTRITRAVRRLGRPRSLGMALVEACLEAGR
jgi:hypothetical protein